MELPLRIAIPLVAIETLCRRHPIQRLAVFGSVLRDDFRPDSDVDILAEFEPGRVPGLGFIRIQDELGALLGRTVDLHTPNSLSSYFRERVIRQAHVVYAVA